MFVAKKVNKGSAPLDLHHETHCFGIQMRENSNKPI